jgi:hypothetical protein
VFLDYHLRSKLTAESISGVIIFGSIRFLLKKNNHTEFKKNKKKKNEPKPVQTDWFRFFRTITDSNLFGSVFPVWLGFFGLGSVRFFQF